MEASEATVRNMAKEKLKDDSKMNHLMNEAENIIQHGAALQNATIDRNTDFNNGTQLLGPPAVDPPDGNDSSNDREDAEGGDESSSSSAADMSGGTRRSSGSGGYSGDYSSISDSSSSQDRGAKNKHDNGHHRKGHAERILVRDGTGGERGLMMMGREEVGGKVGIGGSGQVAVSHTARDAMQCDRAQLLDQNSTRDAAYYSAALNKHIHSYHTHRHTHHNHHLNRGAKTKPTKEVNQKIDEIMNLYNVSLDAKRVEDQDGSSNVEATQDITAPQIGGMYDPSDPRVDMQQLHRTAVSIPSSAQEHTTGANASVNSKCLETPENKNPGVTDRAQGECYANLMEACRPFFRDGDALTKSTAQQLASSMRPTDAAGGSQSSGFTSFFTTTKDGSNHSSESLSESSHDKSAAATANQNNAVDQGLPYPGQSPADENQARLNDVNNSDHSDSSSMVVLARVKRKHKDGSHQATSSTSKSGNVNDSRKRSSGDGNTERAAKRVRIDAMALNGVKQCSQAEPPKAHDNETPIKQGGMQRQQRIERSSITSSLTRSLDSSGSDFSGQQKKKDGTNTDSMAQNQASEASQTVQQPRLVTDISSGTGTTTATNRSSGSGTGSSNENNTTSKSESGSGGGNSDKQKASKDCHVASATNEDTKPESQPTAAHNKTEKPHIHYHHHHHGLRETVENGAKLLSEGSNAGPELDQEEVSKEKIMEKKRKRRMNMRREYEEEVQRQTGDSSESSSIADEAALDAGSPVSLEEVLSFTKIARLLVQALPPFLAVHSNAAFTNLCGIQSSSAIGTPIASMLSLPEGILRDAAMNKESDSSQAGMSSLSGSADGGSSQRNSNIAIASATAMQQRDSEAPAAENSQVANGVGLKIDRLIVARHFHGNIHEVLVVSLPHHPRSHAIEGSEVKFMEKSRKKCDSKLLCRMSVSPVISTTQADGHGYTDANSSHQPNNNGQRRKMRPTPNEMSSVKHYLIQLEAVDGPRLLMSRSSSISASIGSNTTMEALLLGITKTEVHSIRCKRNQHQTGGQQGNDRAGHPETEESQEETTSAMEPVATCG